MHCQDKLSRPGIQGDTSGCNARTIFGRPHVGFLYYGQTSERADKQGSFPYMGAICLTEWISNERGSGITKLLADVPSPLEGEGGRRPDEGDKPEITSTRNLPPNPRPPGERGQIHLNSPSGEHGINKYSNRQG